MKTKKLFKSVVAVVLAVIMTAGVTTAAFAADGESYSEGTSSIFNIERISNPESGVREIDGLLDGGDRSTSYTWRLAERGDDIYIATYDNLIAGVINIFSAALAPMGIDEDTVWALTDVITNGEIPRPEDEEGAAIIKYNKTTGEFTKIFVAPEHMQFRMVVTYDGMVYAGTFSSVLPRQYLYRIDENDNVEEVFTTTESFSIRANCVYDAGEGDHLYFAGADEREVLEEGDEDCVRVAVWEKDADDDFVWNRVADYKDFKPYCTDSGMKNNTGCPVWELANHDGYIYAGMPNSKGFIIFRGRPAEDGEEANEYGWIWEEVVGAENGINNPGMAETAEGHADENYSAIVSVYEFNGELYCFDFDQTIMAELAFIQNALYKVAGYDVTLSDMIGPVYSTLHHPQHLWKLNDETGAFEECEGFTELMEGTCNEYVWRAVDYNGYMYVTTMDSAVIYNYLTRLTNGSLYEMSAQEWKEQVTYIGRLMKILAASAAEDNEEIQALLDTVTQLKDMLADAKNFEISDEAVLEFLKKYSNLDEAIEEIVKQIEEKLNEELGGEIADELVPTGGDEEDGAQEEPAQPADDEKIILDDEKLDAIIDTVKSVIAEYLGENALSDEELEELKQQIRERLGLGEDEDEEITVTLGEIIEAVREAVTAFITDISDTLSDIYDSIDWEGLEMYKWVSDTVANDTWGFDMVRTKDGVNFELVTNDGFGDKYNYGSAAFLASEDGGLYIGTCNPFYGGQLYRLTVNDEEEEPEFVYGDVNMNGVLDIVDATLIQRHMAKLEQLSDEQIERGMVSGYDHLMVLDATYIQRKLAGLIDLFPVESGDQPFDPTEPPQN